ncbi:MAG: hypothetical protein M3P89_13715 [Actinomycetota bacterium]|nr:hypothetical protein [Actinomycetota bacterium]
MHDTRGRRTHQLTKATIWVVEEFAFLDELLQGLGCKPRAEKHGYVYESAGRAVVHVHVKLKHLAVGLPPELQPEVDALNAVPSVQQRHAWLTYQPGTCNREEVEGLLVRACDVAAASQGRQARPRGPAPARAGVAPVGSDDEADLALVLKVVRAYAEHASVTGRASGIKVVREAIFFVWEQPRLPGGGKYFASPPALTVGTRAPTGRASEGAGLRARPANLDRRPSSARGRPDR